MCSFMLQTLIFILLARSYVLLLSLSLLQCLSFSISLSLALYRKVLASSFIYHNLFRNLWSDCEMRTFLNSFLLKFNCPTPLALHHYTACCISMIYSSFVRISKSGLSIPIIFFALEYYRNIQKLLYYIYCFSKEKQNGRSLFLQLVLLSSCTSWLSEQCCSGLMLSHKLYNTKSSL